MLQPNLIKGKMREKNLSQSEIARMLGMSKTSVSNKINKKQEFTLTEYLVLCSILEVGVEFFLNPLR